MTEPAPRGVLWIGAGFVVWSSAFGALYGLQALGCAFGWPDGLHRAVLVAVLALHVMVVAVLLKWLRRRQEGRFLQAVTGYALWAALVATVLTYGPALALTACAPRLGPGAGF